MNSAYCGPPPDAANWAASWNTDPVLLAILVVAAVATLRLPASRRPAAFGALAALVVAFVSPLCALTTALFSARAAHHLVLVAVAAPLLARALPLPRPRGITAPFALATATLWLWHVPALYDAALQDTLLYWAMQATLLATAWAFWASAFAAPPMFALAGIAASAGQMGLLGALLTFAPRPLYASHLTTTIPFGIGPLADQQLAGLVMWVPGLLPYAVVAGLIAARHWRAAMQPA
ncbi:cytochrome c oxidase assembly protein [Sphingomonas sp. ac-8]|uniref:cytochrome c oxidase assembly protein n=1 Tax=Sphingomonas sp. ac-8 TaxID=3242977 RepID=UPI003A7F8C04